MNPSEFVQALKTECKDAAVKGCVESFISPPGRNPSKSLKEISNWFSALTETDRQMVVRAMTEAADATLFGVLAVLDGSRSIESHGVKSVFQLSAQKNGVQSVICPGNHDLHDL